MGRRKLSEKKERVMSTENQCVCCPRARRNARPAGTRGSPGEKIGQNYKIEGRKSGKGGKGACRAGIAGHTGLRGSKVNLARREPFPEERETENETQKKTPASLEEKKSPSKGGTAHPTGRRDLKGRKGIMGKEGSGLKKCSPKIRRVPPAEIIATGKKNVKEEEASLKETRASFFRKGGEKPDGSMPGNTRAGIFQVGRIRKKSSTSGEKEKSLYDSCQGQGARKTTTESVKSSARKKKGWL